MEESKGPAAGRDRRSPDADGRKYVMSVRLSGTEKAKVKAAADKAGMALSAWVGDVIVAAAEGKTAPVGQVYRDLLAELAMLRGEVRMTRADLRSAAAEPHAARLPGGDLPASDKYVAKMTERIDAVAERARRLL